MVALAENAVEVAAVKRKLRLLTIEFRHFFFRDREKLRRLEAGLFIGLDVGGRELADHALIVRIAGVLIAAAHGIVAKTIGKDGDLVPQLHVGKQVGGGLRNFARETGQCVDLLLELHKVCLPQLIGAIEIFQTPCVFNSDLASLGNLLRHIVALLCFY